MLIRVNILLLLCILQAMVKELVSILEFQPFAVNIVDPSFL